ncbi:thiolase, partial [Amanita rubescens]
MGITSENVAKDFGITRESQDRFAVSSFQKTVVVLKAGKFRAEIVPIKTKIEKEVEIVVGADDGMKDGITFESLVKLKPAFAKDGSTHVGNASQVSDGTTAVLLARRSVAKRLGLPILGKYVT